MKPIDTKEVATEVAEYELASAPVRDAIGEDQNPIPLWFNVSFHTMVVVGLIYLAYYSLSGWSMAGQYDAEVADFGTQYKAVKSEVADQNPFRGDAVALTSGKETFSTVCAVCHKPDGTGLIGPSLVDPYWKYGADDAALFESVSKGRPGGMPAWGVQLSNDKIWRALAYLETLPREEKPGVGAPTVATPQAAPTGS